MPESDSCDISLSCKNLNKIKQHKQSRKCYGYWSIEADLSLFIYL